MEDLSRKREGGSRVLRCPHDEQDVLDVLHEQPNRVAAL